MRYPTRKVTLDIHGLKIKATQRKFGSDWSTYITIPRNILRKVVALGADKVKVTCAYHYTDDYAYDAATNFGRGDVPLDSRLFTGLFSIFEARHARIYAVLGGKGSIHFGRHQNESYTLSPIDGEIIMTVRE